MGVKYCASAWKYSRLHGDSLHPDCSTRVSCRVSFQIFLLFFRKSKLSSRVEVTSAVKQTSVLVLVSHSSKLKDSTLPGDLFRACLRVSHSSRLKDRTLSGYLIEPLRDGKIFSMCTGSLEDWLHRLLRVLYSEYAPAHKARAATTNGRVKVKRKQGLMLVFQFLLFNTAAALDRIWVVKSHQERKVYIHLWWRLGGGRGG